ncbi:MAG: PRD domain-containing protein [Peptoniphilaceae bacterium]|nr:PRD domain-containing protein [Peptoniphilaceae bacterium]MDD7383449.1 PRD domain-containing protein [Peptoniphilaceae bacterium]MDY3738487.1 PRD domain-containing protein [Peptoniphilaceae bacterium]
MIETRYKKIFDILTSDYNFHTSYEISQIISVSIKTIQKNINELNNILIGAKINSKRGKGYIFEIIDKAAFRDFLKNDWIKYSFEDEDFNNSDYRIKYILFILLFNNDYIKIEELALKLLISNSQLKIDLNKVKEIIKKYNLKIESKPHYGLKLVGNEFNKRMCIKKEIIQYKPEIISELTDESKVIEKIKEIINNIFEKYNFNITDNSFDNLVYHIYVSIKRTKHNDHFFIGARDLLHLRKNREYDISNEILSVIGKRFSVSFSDDEKAYIAMHLLSKRSFDNENKNEITKNVDELVVNMIERVKKVLNIDLSNNLDLRINLGLHIMPLIERINYNLTLKNPILEDIKKDVISYDVATTACTVINEKYKISISEDEVGYIALHFSLALKSMREEKKNKNVLIVCNTGNATAQILKSQFLKEFNNYTGKVETYDSNKIKKKDLKTFDLIITSIPININTNIPIIEIGAFISNKDIRNIKNFFKKQYNIEKFFPKELFLTNLNYRSKDETIYNLVNIINEKKEVDKNLLVEIKKREVLAPTEFDNFIALPHPLNPLSEETFITVGILKEPIIWNTKKVQLIFLMNISKRKKEELKYLYSKIGDFLTDRNKIQKVINNPDYEYFIKIFNNEDY